MKKKILVIEDEHTINDVLCEYINSANYEAIQAYDGIEGIMKFSSDVSLVISDVMMPRMDGYKVVEEIRKSSDVPIVLLTALSDEEDVLRGYDLGVDEYVSKPFSPKIIIKKIDAILARKQIKTDTIITQKGIISISLETMIVRINNDSIHLSKKQFELLHLFFDNENIVFTRDQLLNKIWGYDYFGDDRVVDTCIKRLRKKIGPAKDYIKTVFGVGYKFEVQHDS